jgi:N-dimethylarginine dimethylaminohydrolase
MVAPLRRVVVKRPEDAFCDTASIEKQWRDLGYSRPPDLERAARDHQHFVRLLQEAGAEVLYLPQDERTGLDSIYTHDPVLMTELGAVIFQTGKVARRGEGVAIGDALRKWGVPVLDTIGGPATAEAGDMLWLGPRTLVVGRGFRTNTAGIELLAALLMPQGVSVIPVQLPYWKGPREVLHLMSFISLLDEDLAVVYRRLMPIPLFDLLQERKIQLLDVPDEEYDTLGCNVLAVAPRRVVMIAGNGITRRSLEHAGCTVTEFEGTEICLPGAGGPTCLTRPLVRWP